MLHSIPLAWLAQLHVEHEQWSQARIVVEQAQAHVRRYDEYVWMPEIHGLEGCIWRAEGQHHRDQGLACFESSAAPARERGMIVCQQRAEAEFARCRHVEPASRDLPHHRDWGYMKHSRTTASGTLTT